MLFFILEFRKIIMQQIYCCCNLLSNESFRYFESATYGVISIHYFYYLWCHLHTLLLLLMVSSPYSTFTTYGVISILYFYYLWCYLHTLLLLLMVLSPYSPSRYQDCIHESFGDTSGLRRGSNRSGPNETEQQAWRGHQERRDSVVSGLCHRPR